MFVLCVGDVVVSDDVIFYVDSDLNGASPQFTLTCISTGGPATTVTWTRDSEMLTGSAVLNDAETAQYTHTLTVTGRLGGLYRCTVSNGKPSSMSSTYTVEGIILHMHVSCDESSYSRCLYLYIRMVITMLQLPQLPLV